MKIALCTIVKNEEKIITRMLDSVQHIVDGVFIGDTGSTDNTIHEIAMWLDRSNMVGQITPVDWNGFARSRNDALDVVPEGYDYILVLDADEVLVKGEELFKQLADKDALHKDAYGVYVTNGGSYILSPRLLKPRIRYEGVIHNQPVGFKTMGSFKYEDVLIDHVHDGARAFDPEKLEKDIVQLRELFEKTKERNYGFYLGMTFMAKKGFDLEAHMAFSQVADMQIKDDISYSAFMNMGAIQHALNSDVSNFYAYFNFLDAHAIRPTCEALYYLVKISREMKRYDLALRLASRVDFSVMTSYIDPVIRAYEFEMEVLRSFTHVRKEKAQEAAEQLMDKDLPTEVREELNKMIVEL